jgi:hypothetical protein
MTEYRVIWEIDLAADSPEEAAEEAAALMVGEPSVFDVYERLAGQVLPGGVRIDLSGETPPCPITLGVDTASR